MLWDNSDLELRPPEGTENGRPKRNFQPTPSKGHYDCIER
jgi:hypothetical protein